MIDLLVCIASCLPLPLPPPTNLAAEVLGQDKKKVLSTTAGIKQPLLQSRRLFPEHPSYIPSGFSLCPTVHTERADWTDYCAWLLNTNKDVDALANPSFGGCYLLEFALARDLKNSHSFVLPLADRLCICYCFRSACVVSSPAIWRCCVLVHNHQLRRPQMFVHPKISLFVATVPLIKAVNQCETATSEHTGSVWKLRRLFRLLMGKSQILFILVVVIT